jgi:hypothetical protein
VCGEMRSTALVFLAVFNCLWLSMRTASAASGENCSGISGWYLGDQYLFRANDTPDTFTNHQNNCKGLINLSGSSVSLARVEMNNIAFVATSFSSWFTANNQTWVDLTRSTYGFNAPDQGWRWSLSEAFLFNPASWAIGQPDGSGDYAAFDRFGSGISYLVSKPSTAMIGGLCAIKSNN